MATEVATVPVIVLEHKMLGGKNLWCVCVPNEEHANRWDTLNSFESAGEAYGYATAARKLPPELVREYLDVSS